MTAPKRKITVSLDDDLVGELEATGEPVSSQVNEILRNEMAARRRQRLLGEYLDELEAKHGPVDEELVAEFMELLR